MAKEKKSKADVVKPIQAKIYPDEFDQVSEMIREKQELSGVLETRDIRTYFGLKPTHRQTSTKTKIKEAVSKLSEEKQKKILEDLEKE